MKLEQVKLSQVKVNAENPRTITSEKFNKLINSILVLPKMLELRPIVVDNKMCALGGNMRTNALREIAKMSIEKIADRLSSIADFVEKTDGERKVLVEYWAKWLEKPTALIINASELSAAERKQFMIKDNASFGQWNYDALANNWDEAKLEDWGLDVWNANPTAFAPMGTTPSTAQPTPAVPDASEEDNPTAQFQDALPPEINGQDLTPDKLPEYKGEENTPCDYITIIYANSEREVLAKRLGVSSEKLFEKICWRIDELLEMRNKEVGNEQ